MDNRPAWGAVLLFNDPGAASRWTAVPGKALNLNISIFSSQLDLSRASWHKAREFLEKQMVSCWRREALVWEWGNRVAKGVGPSVRHPREYIPSLPLTTSLTSGKLFTSLNFSSLICKMRIPVLSSCSKCLDWCLVGSKDSTSALTIVNKTTDTSRKSCQVD